MDINKIFCKSIVHVSTFLIAKTFAKDAAERFNATFAAAFVPAPATV